MIRYLVGVFLLVSTFALSGCGYLIQAAQGQSQVMQAREPIDRVIASGSTDAALKARLEQHISGLVDRGVPVPEDDIASVKYVKVDLRALESRMNLV